MGLFVATTIGWVPRKFGERFETKKFVEPPPGPLDFFAVRSPTPPPLRGPKTERGGRGTDEAQNKVNS